jgi:ABC-type spermidine/putrescine transport system permease subunit II
VLRTPELYALVLVTIAATVWQQASFQAGTLTASLPTLTVAEPAVGSVLGIVVLGESLQTHDVGMFALALAVIVMATSTVALARDAAVPTEEPRAVPAT